MALANMENQFSHHAIDYGYQVNTIHCEKGCEVVHNVSVCVCVCVCVCVVCVYVCVCVCKHMLSVR